MISKLFEKYMYFKDLLTYLKGKVREGEKALPAVCFPSGHSGPSHWPMGWQGGQGAQDHAGLACSLVTLAHFGKDNVHWL